MRGASLDQDRRQVLTATSTSGLEDNIAAVAHHLRADLDQLVLQTRQRPVLDRLRRRQRAQEIAEVVGERMNGAAPRWRRTFGTTVAST